MKILSNKKYFNLIERLSMQSLEMEELEESNKIARAKYYEQLNCSINATRSLEALQKRLDEANANNQRLQKEVYELSQENRHLEAEIERAKARV